MSRPASAAKQSKRYFPQPCSRIGRVGCMFQGKAQNSVCEFARMSSTDENCTRCRG